MILGLTSSVSLRDHRLVLSETVDSNILLSLANFFFLSGGMAHLALVFTSS